MSRTPVIKAGDRWPPLLLACTDGTTGEAADLSTATTVKVLAARRGASTLTIDATVADRPDNGVIEYEWGSGDTDTPGGYSVVVQVTWPDGKVQTFPGSGVGNYTVERTLP